MPPLAQWLPITTTGFSASQYVLNHTNYLLCKSAIFIASNLRRRTFEGSSVKFDILTIYIL